MARKFQELRARMSPAARARAHSRAKAMLAEMPLQELRRAMEMSQATLAELLGANQPQISKIEHSADLYLSTLRRYVEAIGGKLDLVANFPDGSVRISQFSAIDPSAFEKASHKTAESQPVFLQAVAALRGEMTLAVWDGRQRNDVVSYVEVKTEKYPAENVKLDLAA
jgi:transcriptional regulator with XRE-family HTH domain